MISDWVLWQTAEDDQWIWCLPTADGRFSYPVQTGNLATAANMIGDQATLLLLRSEQLVLTDTSIKARSRRQVAAALPYLLEEQLTVPPDSLHLAIRARKTRGHYQVAVIDRQLLTSLLTRVTNQGIRLIGAFADVQALPESPGSMTVFIDTDRVLVRSADGTGFAAPRAIAGTLLQTLLSQCPLSEQETTPNCYRVGEVSESSETLLATLRLDSDRCQPIGQPLELLARGLDPDRAVNLLQGEFKSYLSQAKKNASLPMLLLMATLLSIQAIAFWQDQTDQRQELATIDQQIDQTYQHHFGMVAPHIDFRQETLNRLNSLRKPGIRTPAFTEQLARVIRQMPPGLTLNQADYADSQLKLKIHAPSLTAADQLGKNLRNANLLHRIEITNRENDYVLLTLTIGPLE